MATFYIIFPRGDRSKIKVKEIPTFEDVNDYSLASQKYFYEESEAIEYAKQLAKDNNIQFISSSGYLD